MKKALFITAAALMLCISAGAQQRDTTRGRRPMGDRIDAAKMIQERTDRMVEKYGLDEAQATKLLELNKKYPGHMMEPGMRGPHNHGGHGGPGMRGQRPGTRPDGQTPRDTMARRGRPDMNGRPQMSEEQTQKMKEQMEKMRKEMEESRTAYNNELKDILTDKQFQAYQEDLQKAPQRGPVRVQENKE